MKKILFYMSAFAVVLSGCSSDSNDGGGMDIDAPSKFKATFENSRAYLGEDDYCYWEIGDEASVFTQTNKNWKFKSYKGDVKMTELTMTEEGVNPTTEITIDDYFAIFPYTAANTVDANGVLYSQLPSTQTYNPSKVDMGTAIMVSRIPSSSNVFEFKNSCALIKFYIKKYSAAVKEVKVKSIEIMSKANNLAGDMYVETAGGDFTAKVATTGTPSKTIMLTNCDAAGALSHEEYTEYLVAIPAGTYAKNDLTISIDTDVDELDYIVTLPKQYVIARSKYIELKTMLGGKSLEINDDVDSKDRAIMCDVPRVEDQGFVGSGDVEYDYEIPTGEFVLNGNNKTYNFSTSSMKIYIINTFTTHQSGYKGVTPPKVTVNDLTISGELRTTTIGVYVDPKKFPERGYDQGAFDTEWNNVKVINNKIIPYAQSIEDGGSAQISMSSAVCVYGKAVINNCVIKGAVYSEKAINEGQWTEAPLYDMAFTNSTKAFINGSTIGSIYGWEQSQITLDQGTTVDEIYTIAISAGNLGLLAVKNATVGHILIDPHTTYDPRLQIFADAKITTLEFADQPKNAETDANLFDANYWKNVKINPSAKIEKVIVGGVEMTLTDLISKYNIATI